MSRISVSQISLLPTVSRVGSVLKMDMRGLVLFFEKKTKSQKEVGLRIIIIQASSTDVSFKTIVRDFTKRQTSQTTPLPLPIPS